MQKAEKHFDAVEMSRRLRQRTSRKLMSMSTRQRMNALNKHLEKFPRLVRLNKQQMAHA